MVKKNRILITGGFGFIGGRLAQYLSAGSDIEVLIASRENRDIPDWLNKGKVLRIDWNSSASIAASCRDVNTIIHTAGLNSQECSKEPERAFLVNACYTARLLSATRRQGVSRFIYLSTVHVYDSRLSGQISEQTATANDHPYAASHRAAETLVSYCCRDSGIKPFILRLSNAFGAPISPDVNCWQLVINDLCKQAVQCKQMKIRSTGLQMRDFIPLSQVCTSIGELINNNIESENQQVFNLSSGNSTSIIDMAVNIQSRCHSLFGYSPPIIRETSTLPSSKEFLIIRNDRIKPFLNLPLHKNGDEIDNLLRFCSRHFC